MKAGLVLAVLSFVVVAQAKYELSCAQAELGVRWPSYESNSEYYVCPNLFGRQLTVACNPGEVFTFVLQSCTAPSRYIPAPALEMLPTAAPLMGKPNKDGYLKPTEIVNDPSALRPYTEIPKREEASQIQQEEGIAIVEETNKPLAPLPLTPAPKQPVAPKKPRKKPNGASGKKPKSKKKTSIISHSATTASGDEPRRKPSKVSGKKTPVKMNGKQKSAANKTPNKSGKKSKAVEKKQRKV